MTPSGFDEGAPGRCPGCGERGRTLPRHTPRALLRPEALERLPRAALLLCAGPACPVVYFATECEFRSSDLRVPVYSKEPPGERTLCYCLELSERCLRSPAGPEQLERVRALVQSGRCACELRNPEGRCCLGAIEAWLATDGEPPEQASMTQP